MRDCGVQFVMGGEGGGLLGTVLGLVCTASFVVILGAAVIGPASSITKRLKCAYVDAHFSESKLLRPFSRPFRCSVEKTASTIKCLVD